MPLKVILIGGSVSNLYAAKNLNRLGCDCTIYEKKENFENDQTRLLPHALLKKMGYAKLNNEENQYVKLTDLKRNLADDINIQFNTKVVVDYNTEEVFIKDKKIDFDFAIVVTGHKQIPSKNKKIFTYNYVLNESNNNYAGRSLITAIEKVEKIIEKLRMET